MTNDGNHHRDRRMPGNKHNERVSDHVNKEVEVFIAQSEFDINVYGPLITATDSSSSEPCYYLPINISSHPSLKVLNHAKCCKKSNIPKSMRKRRKEKLRIVN